MTAGLDDALAGLRAYREIAGRRDDLIRAARAAGADITTISREGGISRPTVYEALKRETAMRTLEFTCRGGTIGGAQDVARQATPVEEAVPSVQQAGRLGFEITAGAEVIALLRAELEERGEECIVTEVR